MALVGLSLSGVSKFESKFDPAKGTENATVFLLGTLDVFLTSYLTDKAVSFLQGEDGQAAGIEFKNNQIAIEAVRFGLKGWTNFKDNAGNDIAFKTLKRNVNGRDYVVASDESLKWLDLDVIRELAEELRRINTLSKGEEKNSDSASLPSS